MGNVALVTGVSRSPAATLLQLLAADPSIDRVIGVDLVPPQSPVPGVEFIRTDITTPAIGKLIEEHRPSTVVHAATPPTLDGRSAHRELALLGTMQLVAGCQRVNDLRVFVLQSSAAVYGGSAGDPAVFTEDAEPRAPLRGRARDSAEIERYVRALGRRRPDLRLSILRLAHVVGPDVHTPLARYLRLPMVPTMLGFDPRLQFLHASDAAAVLHRAAVDDVAGTYNVAGDGVLFLSQSVRRLGRVPVPVPAVALASVAAALGARHIGDLMASGDLQYGRALDTTRMRTAFGFAPEHNSARALVTGLAGGADVAA